MDGRTSGWLGSGLSTEKVQLEPHIQPLPGPQSLPPRRGTALPTPFLPRVLAGCKEPRAGLSPASRKPYPAATTANSKASRIIRAENAKPTGDWPRPRRCSRSSGVWQTRVGTVSEARSVQETHVPPPECTPVHGCVYMGVTHLCWGWPHVSPASCRAGVWMGRHASGCRAHPCTPTRTTCILTGCPSAPACHLASPGTGGSAPRRPLPREGGRSQGQRGSTTQSPPSRMRPQPASVQGRGCRDPTAGPQVSPLPSCPETEAQARVGLRGPGELPQWASPWLWGGRGFSPPLVSAL